MLIILNGITNTFIFFIFFMPSIPSGTVHVDETKGAEATDVLGVPDIVQLIASRRRMIVAKVGIAIVIDFIFMASYLSGLCMMIDCASESTVEIAMITISMISAIVCFIAIGWGFYAGFQLSREYQHLLP